MPQDENRARKYTEEKSTQTNIFYVWMTTNGTS
jgi:hypothetical protein